MNLKNLHDFSQQFMPTKPLEQDDIHNLKMIILPNNYSELSLIKLFFKLSNLVILKVFLVT
ncbi:hypothetical protein LBMAG18_05110 [Alphaproteobacteria bacterium]|nr:hypothetical protein LBMAG18_05110 [Alphaproteobacteria bacterium]